MKYRINLRRKHFAQLFLIVIGAFNLIAFQNCSSSGMTSSQVQSVTPAALSGGGGTPPTAPGPVGTGSFILGQRPFLATSTWNTPVSASASYTPFSWVNGAYYMFGWSKYSTAVYVTNPSDPLVTITTVASWGWPAETLSLHLPSGVTGAPGSDAELIIIDGNNVHNFWVFNRINDNSATAKAYGRTNLLTGDGWGKASPFLGAGIVGAAASEFAGLLVQAETDAGEINHALQIEMPGPMQAPGRTGGAIGADGHSPTGVVQEGDRLAIPPSVAMPAGLSPLGQKVFRALQKYGCFDIDTTDNITVSFRAQQNAYDSATMTALDSDIRIIAPLLQLVQ